MTETIYQKLSLELKNKRVVLSPHAATFTQECLSKMSIETAQWLTSNMNINIEIDMDYNSDKSYQSSKLISATKGWGNSLGYKVNVKPEIQIATRAADFWCKGGY